MKIERVLMTADTVGGVWTYAMQLADALDRHGVEVALATMGGPVSPGQRAEASAIPSLRLYESTFKMEWMENPWDDVEKAGQWLLDLEQETRPDVVHLNTYSFGALSWHAPALVVGHSCVLSWWEACRNQQAPPEWNRYAEEVRRGIQGANMVAAPTEAMLASLDRHYGPISVKRVISNGRDPALFPPAAKEPIVFAAGRVWDEAKNIAALDESAPDLTWPVYVAGDDMNPNGQRATTRNVRFTGRLDLSDMASMYGRASIYCLPARYEPFGLSALEAGLAGCALVLGDIPTLREVWDEAAVFVPTDDTAALTQTLQSLMNNDQKRVAMAAQARTRAMQFTPESLATGYMNSYRQMSARSEEPAVAMT
ncbi:MAG: glycosyltransferase family 4 protein [Dehalococcoidia bacterium]